MGKAIVLLHGFLSDFGDFEPLFEYLSTRYDHIEKISYPGHRENENYWDFDCDKTFEVVENAFLPLIDRFESIDVIGFSMGGALAVYLSNKYHFNKLILLSPANKYFNFYLPYSMFRYYFTNLVNLEKAVIKKNNDDIYKFREKISLALEDDKEGLKFIQERYLKTYFLKAFKNLRNLVRRANKNVLEIKNPCFIAWGKLDQLVPRKSADVLYKMCTNEIKQLKIYDDLSHLMLRSTSHQILLQDILEFLDK